MFRTIGAVLIVGVNDGFCIAVCIKGVAELFQLVAEFAVVIDFPIEDNPGAAVLIVDRLLAAFQIYDRQPAHTQADALAEVEAIFIRATMAYGFAHARDKRLIHRRIIVLDYAYNSAHK